MKAIVFQEAHKIVYTDVEKPSVGLDDVLIRVKACGICAKTDARLLEGGFLANFPFIPGHEFAGVVEEVGEQVNEVKVGDCIAVDNPFYCRECYYCKTNQEHFCENFRSLGVTDDGGFAEYAVLHKSQANHIGDLTFEQAALAEPVACVVHGMDLLKPKFGSEVLLFGAGPIGLMLLQAVKHYGASRVVVLDPNESKLELAEQLGATETILVKRDDFRLHEEKLHRENRLGFDAVIEATGAAEVAERALQFVGKGGKLLYFGNPPEGVTISINPNDVFFKEITIFGSFAQLYNFQPALRFLQSGAIQVDPLISHRFPLAEFEDAMDLIKTSHRKLKVMIIP